MIESTNNLLVIEETIHNELGILLLIMSGIVIFYILLSVEFKRQRVEKMKRAATLIKEGHERRLAAEKRNKRV